MKNIIAISLILSSFIALHLNAAYAYEVKRLAELFFPSSDQILLTDPQSLSDNEFNEIKKAVTQLRLDGPCFYQNQDNFPFSSFRKYELSGDGKYDYVFSSMCGTEEGRNHIWLRKGKSLEYAGFIEGSIIRKFKKEKKGRAYLLVSKGWCCAGYSGSTILYELKELNNRWIYSPVRKIMVFGGVVVPEQRMKPINFIVRSSSGKLRNSPEIYNDIDPYLSGITGQTVHGNITAEFVQGSNGTAISELRDKAGNLWWFVLMDNEAKVITNHFYDDEDGFRSGWMNSSDLQVVD